MISRNLLTFLSILIFTSTFSQTNSVGIFEIGADVGNPKQAGSSHYDKANQAYTLKGGGYNIWFQRDEFHFLSRKLKGDFILTANFELKGKGVDPHRKVGWMIRESEESDASHISAVLHGDGLTVLQWRALRGAYMRDPDDEVFAPKKNYQIIQMERQGKTIIMRAAQVGEPLQEIGSHIMENLLDDVLGGLFILHPRPDERLGRGLDAENKEPERQRRDRGAPDRADSRPRSRGGGARDAERLRFRLRAD